MAKKVEVVETGEEIAPEEMTTKESMRKKKGKKTTFKIRE